METFRQIAISLPVHQAIEKMRISFDETEDMILKRLLDLHQIKGVQLISPDPIIADRINSWSYSHGSKRIELPHGTKLRAEYNKQHVRGEIIEGKFVVSGKIYDSPSDAASSAFRTKRGRMTSLNGNKYWQCQLPNSANWIPISELYRPWLIDTSL